MLASHLDILPGNLLLLSTCSSLCGTADAAPQWLCKLGLGLFKETFFSDVIIPGKNHKVPKTFKQTCLHPNHMYHKE
jgi:hypothetical protein